MSSRKRAAAALTARAPTRARGAVPAETPPAPPAAQLFAGMRFAAHNLSGADNMAAVVRRHGGELLTRARPRAAPATHIVCDSGTRMRVDDVAAVRRTAHADADAPVVRREWVRASAARPRALALAATTRKSHRARAHGHSSRAPAVRQRAAARAAGRARVCAAPRRRR
jgi:hypothetical protein